MDRKQILKDFIMNELAGDHEINNWGNDDSLLESGIVDSIGILKLLTFIEEKFAVKLSEDDLVPDNFETISSMFNLIQNREVLN